MSGGRTIFHVGLCPDARGAAWKVFCESGDGPGALYAWAPDAWAGGNPPAPVRRALWRGMLAAGGGTVGFTAGRDRVGPGSLWRESRQGWLARRLKPLPGMIWTGDAETFDACFGARWQCGAQVAFALGRGARIPEIPPALVASWTADGVAVLPDLPRGVGLAVKSGANGRVFGVFAGKSAELDRFADAFRAGLDWRVTTFQRAREAELERTLARLSARAAEAPTAATERWYNEEDQGGHRG